MCVSGRLTVELVVGIAVLVVVLGAADGVAGGGEKRLDGSLGVM